MAIKEFLRSNYLKIKEIKSLYSDLIFGHKSYKKFVIISDSRTGSTLLMQQLNLHPNILTLGEEFKNLEKKTCKQIWDNIFRKRQKKVEMMGFKLFYFHPRNSKDQEVWELIEKNEEFIIIHLTRKNILRSYTSKQIGLKTGLWTENKARPHNLEKNKKKVHINWKDCLENFERTEGYIRNTNSTYKNHKIISVIYEDLDHDKQKEMSRIFKELGVDDKKVNTNMKKQNPEKLEDLIANYEELKREFKDSRWKFFFD